MLARVRSVLAAAAALVLSAGRPTLSDRSEPVRAPLRRRELPIHRAPTRRERRRVQRAWKRALGINQKATVW